MAASETRRLDDEELEKVERHHSSGLTPGDLRVLALVAEVRHFRDMHARAAADAQAASEPAAFRGSVAEFLESIGEAVPSVVANNPSSLGGDVRVVELRGGVESLKLTEDEIEALRWTAQSAVDHWSAKFGECAQLDRARIALAAIDKLIGGGR